jgi:hypothetical protein
MIASTMELARSSEARIVKSSLGRILTAYSVPLYTSVWPFFLPNPLTSVIGYPCHPDSGELVLYVLQAVRPNEGIDTFHSGVSLKSFSNFYNPKSGPPFWSGENRTSWLATPSEIRLDSTHRRTSRVRACSPILS